MYKKTCPSCKGNSYSAACRGQWICPYCDADITCVEPQPAGRHIEMNTKRDNSKVANLHDYLVSKDKNVLYR